MCKLVSPKDSRQTVLFGTAVELKGDRGIVSTLPAKDPRDASQNDLLDEKMAGDPDYCIDIDQLDKYRIPGWLFISSTVVMWIFIAFSILGFVFGLTLAFRQPEIAAQTVTSELANDTSRVITLATLDTCCSSPQLPVTTGKPPVNTTDNHSSNKGRADVAEPELAQTANQCPFFPKYWDFVARNVLVPYMYNPLTDFTISYDSVLYYCLFVAFCLGGTGFVMGMGQRSADCRTCHKLIFSYKLVSVQALLERPCVMLHVEWLWLRSAWFGAYITIDCTLYGVNCVRMFVSPGCDLATEDVFLYVLAYLALLVALFVKLTAVFIAVHQMLFYANLKKNVKLELMGRAEEHIAGEKKRCEQCGNLLDDNYKDEVEAWGMA